MNSQLQAHFVYRMAAFSWSELEPYVLNEDLSFLNRKDIKQALDLANPEFMSRVTLELKAKKTLSKESLFTLRNYLIRMSTRSTPFGAFSGIGVGQFASKEDVPEAKVNFKKKLFINLDTPQTSNRLFVVNPTLIDFGSTVRYLKKRKKGKAFFFAETRAQLPSSVKRLIKASKTSFSLGSAIDLLTQGEKDLRDDAKELLSQLLELQLIQPAIKRRLKSSPRLLNEVFYPESIAKSHAMSSQHTVLIYDQKISLHQHDGIRMLSATERLAPVFSRRSDERRFKLLGALKKFLTINNDNPVVPFLSITEDALTPHLESAVRRRVDQLDQYLASKIQSLERAKENIWRISPEDWDVFMSESQPAVRRPDVFSLLATRVIKENHQADYIIQGMVARSATRLIGRFATFSTEIRELIRAIHSIEQKQILPAIAADLELEPLSEKHKMLLQKESGIEFFIDLAGNSSSDGARIPASDLAWVYEGVGEPRLISLSRNTFVEPILTHAYNTEFDGHFYYKLLGEYCQRSGGIEPIWDWGLCGHFFEHFPRVYLGSLIVSKESWYLRLPDKCSDPQKWLREQIALRSLPKETFLVEGDQTLYCNHQTEHGMACLVSRLKREKRLVLLEVLPNELDGASEINLFGIPKDLKKDEEVSKYYMPNSFWHPQSDSSFRGRISSSEPLFLYLKIYLNIMDADSVLLEIARLLKDSDWFFIRYQDPENQLRLRLFFKNRAEKAKISKRLGEFLDQKMNVGLIYRVVRSSYHRETFRYGGKEGLLFFEKLSCFDSKFCTSLLHQASHQGINLNTLGSRHALQTLMMQWWIDLFWPEQKRPGFIKAVLEDFYIKTGVGRKNPKPEAKITNDLDSIFTRVANKLKSEALKKRLEFEGLTKRWPLQRKRRFCQSFLHICFNRLHAESETEDERQSYLRLLHKYEKSSPIRASKIK